MYLLQKFGAFRRSESHEIVSMVATRIGEMECGEMRRPESSIWKKYLDGLIGKFFMGYAIVIPKVGKVRVFQS